MSDDWDADNFDVDKGFVGTGDRWEGEDEEDVKDNWEDSDEDENAAPTEKGPVRKSRKKLEDIIKEKEEKRRQDLEAKRKAEEEARAQMTPEAIHAEKMRLQKLQEDSDLTMALETMGISNDELKGRGGIEAMNPKSGSEFTDYQNALIETIAKHKSSPGYAQFFVAFVRELAVSLSDPEDVRLASTALNVVANEKAKEKKGKGKKKKQKAVASEEAYDDFVEGEYAEFEDFM